jgi:hypothetical protein
MKLIDILNKFLTPLLFLPLIVLVFFSQDESYPQYKNQWMSVGSLHNWYSEIGCELEEAWVKRQQYGMQWPAIYRYQDMQAAKGFWIGCKDFVDDKGNNFPYKVVTVGPRNPQFFAAYPIKFEMIAKFDPTIVSVDGVPSFQKDFTIDKKDETMKWDRMLLNVVNTQLGVTMERKIFQFSQQYNDNYIVQEYTFTNTGNTDDDEAIELPSTTIKDMYVFWTYRNSVNASVRYVIGNSTGWGKNTMNDARGDGVKIDPPGQQYRCQFSWHGYTAEKDVSYDNIGGPIWALNSNALVYNNPKDTIGRLGGTQFLGTLTLYADKSPTDKTDDITQPRTTSYEDSDSRLLLAGLDNAFNVDRMTQQYDFMSKGHQSPRHADLVEPSGDFAIQKTNPNLGNGGGFSFNNAYGPYTLAPGESITVILVEGAAGMNRADQIKYGVQFRAGQLSAEQKNRLVLDKGRDSLFLTFQRATEVFNNNWDMPQPPRPPVTFDVNSGGDRISLNWTLDGTDPNPPSGFRIYRAVGDYDEEYTLVASLDASARSFDDITVVRGFNYFYYMECVGADQPGGAGTPPGKLVSSRYYTQTYDPANLKRVAGEKLSDIRIVPNPYIVNASNDVRFPGTIDEDKIAFYNIPGNCTIKIYTELGELIKTIEHTDGSGDAYWYSVTSSNQIVVSGIYIAVITDNSTGEKHIAKFAVIR